MKMQNIHRPFTARNTPQPMMYGAMKLSSHVRMIFRVRDIKPFENIRRSLLTLELGTNLEFAFELHKDVHQRYSIMSNRNSWNLGNSL